MSKILTRNCESFLGTVTVPWELQTSEMIIMIAAIPKALLYDKKIYFATKSEKALFGALLITFFLLMNNMIEKIKKLVGMYGTEIL